MREPEEASYKLTKTELQDMIADAVNKATTKVVDTTSARKKEATGTKGASSVFSVFSSGDRVPICARAQKAAR